MRPKFWGFALLGVTASAVIGAVVLGVLAGLGHVDQAATMRWTVALAGAGEISFWAGGSLVGLSALKARRPILSSLRPMAIFRRTSP
ncbi:MAG: hypothetical protein V2I43_08560 [Parvularcula sp.]|jgi:hypothetical protein|nr:hypothetical protein [Parvularcula sp.]